MLAAAGYKLWKNSSAITTDNIDILIFGNVVAFIVALIAIKSFIAFLTKYGFKMFGYYRIVVGVVILLLLGMGYQLEVS
jgi:undecaprenyl-diphosphatase